jgi:hypothetical protein
LAARQARPARFKPEPFLASPLAAYELVVAQRGRAYDATVAPGDVWSVLTLLPGRGREYTRQEFARDLYLLDQSGVTQVKGRTMSLPASTLRDLVLVIATEEYLDFQRKEYLADFVRKGGAAVKLVVAPDNTRAASFSVGLAEAASGEGFTFARVDAAETRVHRSTRSSSPWPARSTGTAAPHLPAPEPGGCCRHDGRSRLRALRRRGGSGEVKRGRYVSSLGRPPRR